MCVFFVIKKLSSMKLVVNGHNAYIHTGNYSGNVNGSYYENLL